MKKLTMFVMCLLISMWMAGRPANAQWVTTNIAYAKRDVSPLDYYPDDTTTYYQVRGRVTSPHFSTNGSEFFIQDTNDNAGIRVDAGSTIRPALTLYSELEIVGLISQTAGVRRITAELAGDITVTDPNPAPVQPVAGTIGSFLADPETYEGTYVVISNVTAPAGATFPWGSSVSLTVSDATARITMRVDVDMDIDGQLAPTNPFTLYGIFSQFDTSTTPTGGYQILPRSYEDIVQSTDPQPPELFVVNSNRFSVIVSNTLSVTLIAQDRNPGDALVLNLPSAPAGADIQLQTQRVWQLTWTPDSSYENTTNFITVAVTDGTFTNEVVLEVDVLSELLGNVKINEIHWDPAPGIAGDASGDGITDSTRDEFVEIVNANTTDVDITGWQLMLGTNPLYTFPATVLTGRTAVVVFGGPSAVGTFGYSTVYFPTSNWPGLANSPGSQSVRLVTDSGAEVSSYSYAAFGTPDMSITRHPDYTGDFVLQTSVVAFVRWTPGTMANGKYFEGTGRTNSPPLLAPPADASVFVGQTSSLSFVAFDPESNTLSFSISNAPPTAVFTDNGDGTASLVYTGLISDIGTFLITVYVSDGIEEPASRSFQLNVLNAQYIGLTLNEICFNPSTAYDANEDGTANSTADEFVEIVNNTTGAVDLTGFMIYDGFGLRHRFSSLWVPTGGSVVVFGGANIFNFWRAPAQQASSGQLGLNNNPPETVILYDPNTNEIARYDLAANSPVGASLTRFPDLNDFWTNHYEISTNTLRGSPGLKTDGTPFYTNVPPTWDSTSDVNIALSNTVSFSVFARAYDGDTITLSASNLPAGATFNATPSIGLATGSFFWASAEPSGVYTSWFYAADKDSVVVTSVIITVSGPPPASGDVWINEIHYDNAGTDVDEGIELAGTAGTDLSDYALYFYNGNGGGVYGTNFCAGVIDDEGCGYGAVWFAYPEIQNGATDGVALVKLSETSVVQFLSYEGSLIASDGPAAGLASADIAVFESSSPIDQSLQLIGTGTTYADFTWVAPTNHSRGSLNANQFITGCGGGGDVDGDGIPDDWETQYFGCTTCAVAEADSDSDGFNNLEEYLADTIPVGAAGSNSFFIIESLTNATTRYIQFLSSTGRLYTLQATADPTDGNSWSNISDEVYGSGAGMSLTDTNAADRQLYRLRVRVP